MDINSLFQSAFAIQLLWPQWNLENVTYKLCVFLCKILFWRNWSGFIVIRCQKIISHVTLVFGPGEALFKKKNHLMTWNIQINPYNRVCVSGATGCGLWHGGWLYQSGGSRAKKEWATLFSHWHVCLWSPYALGRIHYFFFYWVSILVWPYVQLRAPVFSFMLLTALEISTMCYIARCCLNYSW